MQSHPAKSTQQPAPIDEARLHALLGKVVGDFGAAASCSLVLIGEHLGFYRALAEAPLTSAELAERTKTMERYVREWLLNQAAGGYIEHDAATGRYSLPPENALLFANEDSPFSMLGGFQVLSALAKAQPRIEDAFRTGEGMAWGEHHPDLFEGTRRFFRPAYLRSLVGTWIPAIEGAKDKLEKGARVADVGCGHGASTLLMAGAFPKSTFFGFDNHLPSIEHAREAARVAGLSDRVTFEVAKASDFPGDGYDLVCFFDCVHDMGEPAAALERARRTLAPDGTVMIVEPMAGNAVEDNFNPVGRIYSAASVLCCTPNAVATGKTWLGTCATDEAHAEVARAAGLSRFRRACEDPFNRVLEAKP